MKEQKFIPFSTKAEDVFIQMIRELVTDSTNIIPYAGFFGVRNWGDALNAVLLRQLSGKVPLLSSLGTASNRCLLKNPGITYSCIGSILEQASKKKNLIVYGTGFLNSTDWIISEPQKICAVRGPLTAERVTECIGNCPKMYGDPAVLFKECYQSTTDQKYNLGIIPHWSDYQKISHHYADVRGIHVISVDAGATQFIDEICSCRYIASSSLHGLIMADAYGIPTVWIKMLSGMHPDDFKFYDYYGSVRCEREPVNMLSWGIEDICSHADHITHPINCEKLLDVCPFVRSQKTTGSLQE